MSNGHCNVIRYFNETKKCVDLRYLNSSFFGHGTAIDLRGEFDECIKELDPSKCSKTQWIACP